MSITLHSMLDALALIIVAMLLISTRPVTPLNVLQPYDADAGTDFNPETGGTEFCAHTHALSEAASNSGEVF